MYSHLICFIFFGFIFVSMPCSNVSDKNAPYSLNLCLDLCIFLYLQIYCTTLVLLVVLLLERFCFWMLLRSLFIKFSGCNYFY